MTRTDPKCFVTCVNVTEAMDVAFSMLQPAERGGISPFPSGLTCRVKMTPEAHAAFVTALLKRLDADPDVLGLVLLGSSSGEPPGPDEFSDHDLFVVTRSGAQERFRNDLGWLPNAADLVLSFRETAHGVRALDRSGHVVEFAVFDLDELDLARVNRYSVPLDKADVRERVRRVQQTTAALQPPDPRWLAGQFLTELAVGAMRYGRGERTSAHLRVRAQAVQHLLGLARLRATADQRGRLDALDVSRRVESVLPEVARAIESAVRAPIPAAIRALLALGQRLAPDLVPPGVPAVLESLIARAEAAAPTVT